MPAEDAIGLTGPEYEMDIERGKIRDFARAMSAPLPEFIDAPRPLIPASFLITAAYSWGYSLERPRGTVFEQIDHDLSVPLHAEESFRFHGALPRAGERLHCRASLENVWRKQGGRGGDLTFLTMLTEFRNPAGELLAEERSTTVTTENAPESGDWNVDIPDYRPDYPENLDAVDYFAQVERSSWEQVEVGMSCGRIDIGPLRIGDIVRFQSVVGRRQPAALRPGLGPLHGLPECVRAGVAPGKPVGGARGALARPRRGALFQGAFSQRLLAGRCPGP